MFKSGWSSKQTNTFITEIIECSEFCLQPDETSLNFAYAVLKSDGPAAQQKACGVCLLDVDQQGPNSNGDIMAKLSYGGRQYHAPCANFWVNCVDSMLPALRLPDLLWGCDWQALWFTNLYASEE